MKKIVKITIGIAFIVIIAICVMCKLDVVEKTLCETVSVCLIITIILLIHLLLRIDRQQYPNRYDF